MATVRYNPADYNSAIRAAIRCAKKTSKPWYVVATTRGYTVWHEKLFGQMAFMAEPDGTTSALPAAWMPPLPR